jgi:signal transduction histidine kinase
VDALRRLTGAWSRQRLSAVRLPQRRRRVAWALAVVAPIAIAVGSRLARPSIPPASILFSTLLVVVGVALLGGARTALAAVLVGLLAQEVFFGFPYGSLRDHKPAQLSILVEFVLVGAVVGLLVDQLTRLTAEQTALRRLAVLVATEAATDELFTAVVEEVGRLLPADVATMIRYESDDTATVVASWGATSLQLNVGSTLPLGGNNLTTIVAETRRAARIDSYDESSGQIGEQVLDAGLRQTVGAPIIVEDRLWGMIAGSSAQQPLPVAAEARLADFTELLATAIGNAESRSELAASRARVVAAADDTRRQIERDLHDGAQQWLVSLGLELRAVQAMVPPELSVLRGELSRVVDGLAGVLEQLREMARGIHPAMLAEGGLEQALKVLARRSPVPVDLHVRAEGRLPERVEVATYYVVSEALANAAKHAHAAAIHVDVEAVEHAIRVCVRDDGAGGASRRRGSGLVGLADRVEALGGTITVRSPVGAGTSVQVELPLDD